MVIDLRSIGVHEKVVVYFSEKRILYLIIADDFRNKQIWKKMFFYFYVKLVLMSAF